MNHNPESGEHREAIDYFTKILPQIRSSEGCNFEIIDCIQGPGETIFVPGGWWHAVLNLDETMAVTQNFTCPGDFEKVWLDFRSSRKKLSTFFLKILQRKNLSMYNKAIEMNKRDKFVMFPERKGQPLFTQDDTTTSVDYTSSSDSSSSTSYESGDIVRGESESESPLKKKYDCVNQN
jgi:histone arginine demethylase JMJD6